MTLWLAALLGLVQGLTEFLPISSTAHLRLVPAWLGQPDAGAAFTAVIQLGTLLAVFLYFAKDLARMARAVLVDRRGPDARLAGYLVLGTLPIAIAGLAFRHVIVGEQLRSLKVIAYALIGVALLMVWAERRYKDSAGARTAHELDWKYALLIGAAQALALIPGVSRSGATITAALFLGFRREDGARLSFLLAIPAVGGAGLFEVPDAVRALGANAWAPLLVGAAVAAVSGYATIAWLLAFLRRHSLGAFAGYRVALGVLLLALLYTGRLMAL